MPEVQHFEYGFGKKARRHIKCRNYFTAFKLLVENSQKAKEAFLRLTQEMANKEVTEFNKKNKDTTLDLNKGHYRDSMDEFTWVQPIRVLQKSLPTLSHVLSGTLANSRHRDEVRIYDNQVGAKVRTLGVVTSMVLKTRFPQRFGLVPSMLGMFLYRGGASNEVITTFNQIGLCASTKHTLKMCTEYIKEHDKVVNDALYVIENQIAYLHEANEGAQHMEVEYDSETTLSAGSTEETTSAESTDIEDMEVLDQPQDVLDGNIKTYSVTWDNVGKTIRKRQQLDSETGAQHYRSWANAIAVFNRIPPPHPISDDSAEGIKATSIEICKILPDASTWFHVQKRMMHLVMRTLMDNVPYFKNLKKHIQDHIPHAYSHYSSRKSEIINLGVLEEDPISVGGVMAITDWLSKYVPRVPSGKHWPILANGDQLSVARMAQARVGRATTEDPGDRCLGLEPVAQEWHMRNVLLQHYSTLMDPQMARQDGSLYNIKEMFRFRGINVQEPSRSVHQWMEFVNFATDGFILMLYLKVSNLISLDKVPKDFPDSTEDKVDYLINVAMKIVKSIHPDTKDNQSVVIAEGKRKTFCVCKKNRANTKMVECSARELCQRGWWFHLPCVGVPQSHPAVEGDEDWWCSPDCQQYSTFCFCRQRKATPPERVCSNANCTGGRRFHEDCIAKYTMNIPKARNKWYCTPQCAANVSNQSDSIQQYSQYCTWLGLLILSHRDAERENDGPFLLDIWKVAMPGFLNHNNHNYLALAHRMLTGVNGWLPKRLQHDVVWNRTANITGGKGKNVSLDYAMEKENRGFQGGLRACHGNYTDAQIDRVAQINGAFNHGISALFQVRQHHPTNNRKNAQSSLSRQEDLGRFVELYKAARLFTSAKKKRRRGTGKGADFTCTYAFVPGKEEDQAKLHDIGARIFSMSKKLDLERMVLL